MQVTPKTDEQIQAEFIWPEGSYPFEVVGAKDKYSQAGNEMIELVIKIWNKDGQEKQIFDYLLDAMSFKVKHFCEGTGLINNYNDGNLAGEDCIGKCGVLELGIKPEQTKNGTTYAAKNQVKDYSKEAKKDGNEFVDSEIPF